MKANKESITKLLKIANGQVNGILKMIDEDRYCIDISNQILATISILQKANYEILNAHMCNCLKEETGVEEKMEEFSLLLQKVMK